MTDRLPQGVQLGFDHARRSHSAPLQRRGRFGYKRIDAQRQGPQSASGAAIFFHQAPDFPDKSQQLLQIRIGFRGQTDHGIELEVTHPLGEQHLGPRQDHGLCHLFTNELSEPF